MTQYILSGTREPFSKLANQSANLPCSILLLALLPLYKIYFFPPFEHDLSFSVRNFYSYLLGSDGDDLWRMHSNEQCCSYRIKRKLNEVKINVFDWVPVSECFIYFSYYFFFFSQRDVFLSVTFNAVDLFLSIKPKHRRYFKTSSKLYAHR